MPIEGTPFLGLIFANVTLDDAANWIRARFNQGGFQYVVTPNVDHRVRLDTLAGTPLGDELWTAYTQSGLCLCDSRVLSRLALFFGRTLNVVPGSDLTRHILPLLHTDTPIAIIGSSSEAIAALKAEFALTNVVSHTPPMGMLDNPAAMSAALQFLRDAGPRLIFLAVGSPQSEILCLRAAQANDCIGVALCIGASIDFLTGQQTRAPTWVQRLGFEWAYRLLAEPRRMWRRYLVEGPRIFWIAVRDEKSNMPRS
jgi:N-acetylglucosaminyldiphosphoundecaprenol N-acetyl-beta-D-mannosaminyltransferase